MGDRLSKWYKVRVIEANGVAFSPRENLGFPGESVPAELHPEGTAEEIERLKELAEDRLRIIKCMAIAEDQDWEGVPGMYRNQNPGALLTYVPRSIGTHEVEHLDWNDPLPQVVRDDIDSFDWDAWLATVNLPDTEPNDNPPY